MDSWNGIRFEIKKENPNPPKTHVDLLIADTIVRECLQVFGPGIKCWRIHRRFGDRKPDGGKHIFSFYLYVSNETFENVKKQIEDNRIYQELVSLNMIEKTDFESEDSNPQRTRAAFRYTSAEEWPAEVQESWPLFACGLSEFFLSLLHIMREAKGINQTSKTAAQLLEFYSEMERTIDSLWFNHGRGTLLHQTNAMFGYKPTAVTADCAMVF